MHRLPALTHAAILLSLTGAGCGGGTPKMAGTDAGADAGTDAGTVTITLTISPAALSVAVGGQGTITATIVRGGDFTGPVTIAGAGAPTGITVTGETIPAMETSVPVTIAAGANAMLGMASVSITGSASGITIAPQTLALTVTAAANGMTGQIGMGLEGEKAYDQFGASVALSDDGKRVVIGANLNDGTGNEAGHARVFERSGNSWVQVGADLDGEAAGDRSGTSVAISADGTRVAVGSYLNDGGGNSSGNVRVFDFTAGAWAQVGADIDGTAGDGAGWAIDLSASGHRIVTGGPGVGSVSGDVRVYELMGAVWTQLGGTITLTHEFGHAVSMSAAGTRIAVGQPSAAGISREGSVLIYDWDGTAWTPVGAPLVGEGIADTFGTAVSLSSDGSMLAVGAPSNIGLGADGGGIRGGHVRVYRLTGGTSAQVGVDLDGAIGDHIGAAVALSGDGTRLVAGASNVVRYYNLMGDAWIVFPTPMFLANSKNGEAIAVSADGHTVATGAIYFRGVAGAAAGLVTLYDLP